MASQRRPEVDRALARAFADQGAIPDWALEAAEILEEFDGANVAMVRAAVLAIVQAQLTARPVKRALEEIGLTPYRWRRMTQDNPWIQEAVERIRDLAMAWRDATTLAAIDEARRRMAQGAVAAVATLVELMHPVQPPEIRLKAANSLLDRADWSTAGKSATPTHETHNTAYITLSPAEQQAIEAIMEQVARDMPPAHRTIDVPPTSSNGRAAHGTGETG